MDGTSIASERNTRLLVLPKSRGLLVASWRHVGTPNYEKLFKVGLNGIVKEAKSKLSEIAADPDLYLHARNMLRKGLSMSGNHCHRSCK